MVYRGTITLQLLILVISCYTASSAAVANEKTRSYSDLLKSDSILSDEYKSKVLKEPVAQFLSVPWWPTFISNVINAFNRKAVSETSQFGIIYMANVDDMDEEFDGHFNPHNKDGKPIIEDEKPISPSALENFGNYVVSSPEEVTEGSVHAENMLLDHLEELWMAYQKEYKQTPNFILYYSHMLPAKSTVNNIITRMSRPPFNNVPYRVIAYNLRPKKALHEPTLKENKVNELQLQIENLELYHHKQCAGAARKEEPVEDFARALEEDESLTLSDAVKLLKESLLHEEHVEARNSATATCLIDDSLQGCLSNCIYESLDCDCDTSKKRTSVAAIINELTFSCARSDFGQCSNKWTEDNIGHDDDKCMNQRKLKGMLSTCNPKCIGKPLSRPIDPHDPTNYPGVLDVYANLANFHRPTQSEFCSDGEDDLKRHTIPVDYTAGKTPCRDGHSCGLHGETYHWCYTSFSSHWDYCCTDACSYNHWYRYSWCNSGSTWQKCDGSGTQTSKSKECISAYICGLHRDVSGGTTSPWCYIDYNKNWEYC